MVGVCVHRPRLAGRAALLVALVVVAGATMSIQPSHAAACAGVEGTGWTEHCPEGPTPPARFGAAMAELPTAAGSSMIVLFGGCGRTRTDPTRAGVR